MHPAGWPMIAAMLGEFRGSDAVLKQQSLRQPKIEQTRAIPTHSHRGAGRARLGSRTRHAASISQSTTNENTCPTSPSHLHGSPTLTRWRGSSARATPPRSPRKLSWGFRKHWHAVSPDSLPTRKENGIARSQWEGKHPEPKSRVDERKVVATVKLLGRQTPCSCDEKARIKLYMG